MKKVIAITGLPASGKSLVSEYFNNKNTKVIHLGKFIWDYLDKRGIIKTQETGNMASLYFWAQYKDIPVAEWAEDQINAAKEKIIILDGLRTVEEIEFFRSRYKSNFYLVAVLASPKIRKKREEKRKRFADTYFEIRDKEELIIGVGEVIALSDYFINGNKKKSEVKKQVVALFNKIKRKKSL